MRIFELWSLRSLRKAMMVSCTILFSPLVSADDYQPLIFKDSFIQKRQDIASTLNSLRVTVAAADASHFSKVDLPAAEITVFKPIADAMKSFSEPKWPGTQRPADLVSCKSHSGFALPSYPRVAASCASTYNALWTDGLNRIGSACRYLAQPQDFVETQDPRVINESKLSDMTGLIRVIGEPMRFVEFPANVFDAQMMRKMQIIILKVRSDELLADITKQIQNYDRMESALNERPNCFSGDVASARGKLAPLRKELETAKAQLENLVRQGIEEATRDADRVRATGRKRPALPHPSLTDEERGLLSFYMGALYWRARGGGIVDEPPGTQATRIYFTKIPMTALAELNGGKQARELGSRIYEQLFKAWGEYMDMGTTPNKGDIYHDATFMTDRGRYQVKTAVSALQSLGGDASLLMAGGMQMGPCYYYSFEKLFPFRLMPTWAPPYSAVVDGYTALGELCTGAAISWGLSQSLLKGYR